MGFSANFPRKIRKLDFLELFLNGKIYGLGPRGCRPCRPSPSWTSGHCLMPEVIGARPPAALVAGVAGRGKGEHGGPCSGLTGDQKAMERWCVGGEGSGGESSSAGRSGLRNGARRSGGGVVGGGDAGAPFYRVGVGARRPSVGGQWAMAVVHRNGGGGDCFRRRLTEVVVGSDERGGGAPAVTGVEGAPGGAMRTHTRRWRWLWPSVWGGRRLGGAHVSARGGGNGEGGLKGAEERAGRERVVAQREHWG
jgi:hypothetical protein